MGGAHDTRRTPYAGVDRVRFQETVSTPHSRSTPGGCDEGILDWSGARQCVPVRRKTSPDMFDE